MTQISSPQSLSSALGKGCAKTPRPYASICLLSGAVFVCAWMSVPWAWLGQAVVEAGELKGIPQALLYCIHKASACPAFVLNDGFRRISTS